jgi:hypothetical protein
MATNAELEQILRRIQALATNPHWTMARRWRVEELARHGLELLGRPEEAAPDKPLATAQSPDVG